MWFVFSCVFGSPATFKMPGRRNLDGARGTISERGFGIEINAYVRGSKEKPEREVSLQLWIASRLFESHKVRTLFNPRYFNTAPHQTDEEAMRARRAEVESILSTGERLIGGDMDEVHDVNLTVKRGEIPLRIYVPKSSPGRSSHAFKGVLLWMHGGGWMFGTVESHDAMSKDLAAESEMIVVSVGYRLAPEVKFPVPVQDCLAAVQWVKKYIWAFGGDKTQLALVGESTGANLALATALQMGSSWFPLIRKKSGLCAVVAASPPLSYDHALQAVNEEDDGEWRSYKRYSTGYGLEAEQMKEYWESYLQKDKHGRRVLASPLRAPNRMLKCLPPVMLIRAEHEILWDEISEMGRNLADAGQEVVEIQNKACIHGMFAKGGSSCGLFSLRDAGAFLKEHCS